MYEKHYGLKKRPFNMTPDSHYFYSSAKHEEALNQLLLAITEKNGFAVITGEVGSGKTTITRTLFNKLREETKVALILNTYLTRTELLTSVLDDLDIKYTSRSKTHLLKAFYEYLLEQASLGNTVVLLIDEAQNLSIPVLEELRMLSNMETETEKLLQIILVGQPELRDKLTNPKLQQFSQRVVFYYHLEALDREESEEYINHRLKISGLEENRNIFTKGAMEEIYAYSEGIPRLVNLVCHNSLITGLVKGTDTITTDIVRESKKDLMHGSFGTISTNLMNKLKQYDTEEVDQWEGLPKL